jgi:hypothetical protein
MLEKKLVKQYAITIVDRKSVHFAIVGAKCSKVELWVGKTLLSSVAPEYGSDWKIDSPVELPFFGDKPFHCALTDATIRIIMHTEEDDIPSIRMKLGETLARSNEDVYEEEVIAQSSNGPKKAILCYHRLGCGYKSITL